MWVGTDMRVGPVMRLGHVSSMGKEKMSCMVCGISENSLIFFLMVFMFKCSRYFWIQWEGSGLIALYPLELYFRIIDLCFLI